MVGLGAIVICFLYIWIAAKLVRKLPSMTTTERYKKIVSAVVWFAVLWFPVIEPAISYVSYKIYAYEHAGPKIYSTVSNVERIHVKDFGDTGRISMRWNKDAFADDGRSRNMMAYDFVEYDSNGKTYEMSYEGDHPGGVIIAKSKSQYFVNGGFVADTRCYIAYEYRICDDTGHVIATCQYVLWRGGEISKFELLGRGGFHERTPEKFNEAKFVHSVLKPRIAK